MSKRLIFVSFWQDALEDIIKFLEEKEYQDTAMIEHLKELRDWRD